MFAPGKNFNANQLHFLGLLVDVLARNGLVDVGQLYDSPFTALAPGGPEDIFPKADVDALVSVLDEVRATAMPDAEAV